MAPLFDEQQTLADFHAALRASATMATVFDDEQIYSLDREPLEDELSTLRAPAFVFFPGPWEPTYYGPGVMRIEPYPINALVIAETWDASSESDRWTDPTHGAAQLRSTALQAVEELGSDGVFALTASGHEIECIDDPQMAPPGVLGFQDGSDMSIAGFTIPYHLRVT